MHTLVIDCNYLCHRARHTTGELIYHGQHTGVIHGFFTQVLPLLYKYRPDRLVFTWDSRRSHRQKRFPWYKDRPKTPSAIDPIEDFKQFNLLRDHLLFEAGFQNVFVKTGFEADDLIARLAATQGKTTIVTGDEDLYQVLSPLVSIYSPGKKKEITRASFIEEYGITPAQWVEVKKIAGCSSDMIPGVPGVGEKTAIKYLRGELKTTHAKYRAIIDNAEIIERNDWLVRLPLPGTPQLQVRDDAIDTTGFRALCTRFGLFKLMNTIPEWEAYYGAYLGE